MINEFDLLSLGYVNRDNTSPSGDFIDFKHPDYLGYLVAIVDQKEIRVDFPNNTNKTSEIFVSFDDFRKWHLKYNDID